ncbi:UDP-glucose 4-epimerase GalE [Stappia indica]|uniref:UDP-glucose 4-epimerase GalE n=1 Tax=Stappia indica TaxID=538381 RepID=UPI001CD339CF|nr:UDP-glucose 4-epimerase GalE [Stappia indica]MCA1297385.1 UDP-glucose 4-epimerase GalE [Stappia indica]
MAILVTGGAGYIGSHMVWTLLDAGEDVVVLDNLCTGHEWAIAGQAHFVRGDIDDPAIIERITNAHDIEAVIHFAGSVVVPESVADPIKYYRNNTCATLALVDHCLKAGINRLIFSSTAALYGAPEEAPVAEDTPLAPLSPYGTSKLMIEQMLRDIAATGALHYAALRYFNVAGADPHQRTGQSTDGATHLIKVACEAATGKRPGMSVFGTDYDTADGTALRDYIHVSDLVNAHYLALQHLRAKSESFTLNCGYGHGYSVYEVIDAVKRLSGNDFPIQLGQRRVGDSPRVIADNTAILEKLDWQPQYADLDLIVRHALDWEKHLAQRNMGAQEGVS